MTQFPPPLEPAGPVPPAAAPTAEPLPPPPAPLAPAAPLAPLAPPRPPHRRARRVLLVLAVVGLLVAAAATAVAVQLARGAGTPQAAVLAYFRALAHGDAAGALAAGAVPPGGQALVTDDVLAGVQRVAPIQDVTATGTRVTGSTATVTVTYHLGGASPVRVDDVVPLVSRGGRWRLQRVAVPLQLSVTEAATWAAVPAAHPFQVPSGSQLVFPGAVPVVFRSPLLQVAPSTRVVLLGGTDDRLAIEAAVTEAGHAQVLRTLQSALAACVKGGTGVDPFCPQPPAGRDSGTPRRSVPGSFHGTLDRSGALAADLAVAAAPTGEITASGAAPAHGDWRVLDYDNTEVDQSGGTTLTFGATLAVGAPGTVRWDRT